MANKLVSEKELFTKTGKEFAALWDFKPENTNTGPPISLNEIQERITELPKK